MSRLQQIIVFQRVAPPALAIEWGRSEIKENGKIELLCPSSNIFLNLCSFFKCQDLNNLLNSKGLPLLLLPIVWGMSKIKENGEIELL